MPSQGVLAAIGMAAVFLLVAAFYIFIFWIIRFRELNGSAPVKQASSVPLPKGIRPKIQRFLFRLPTYFHRPTFFRRKRVTDVEMGPVQPDTSPRPNDAANVMSLADKMRAEIDDGAVKALNKVDNNGQDITDAERQTPEGMLKGGLPEKTKRSVFDLR